MTLDEEVRRLFIANHSYMEIGNMLGLTKGQVAGRCHRMELYRVTPEERAERRTDQRDLDMLADLKDGHSIRDTARHWQVSYNYVRDLAVAAKEAA